MAVATVTGSAGTNASNLAAVHNQLASGGLSGHDNGSGLAYATVPGSAPQAVGGVQGAPSLAGQSAPTEQVVATHTVAPGGGVTLQLNDGSSINVLGATHVDSSLFKP